MRQALLLLACLQEAASIDYVTGTCKEASDIYKESGCCGNPDKNASLSYTDHANCPKSNSTDVPFPLPDPHSISVVFYHIIHCDTVIAEQLKGNETALIAGAVITAKEHHDHCVAISQAADAGKLALQQTTGYTPLGLAICDALMPKEDLGLPTGMTWMVWMVMMGMTVQFNSNKTNEDGSTLKLGSCALTPEYIGRLSSLNHETLVAKQARTPADLTAGENAYLDAWTSPAVGKQYALARQCLEDYGDSGYDDM